VIRLDVDVSKLAVMPGHLQTGVSQQPLQAEDTASVAQKSHCRRVAERVRRTPDTAHSSLLAVVFDDALNPVLGERPALSGKEEEIAVRPCRFGAAAVNITPEAALHLLANRDEAFLVAFAQDLDHAFFQIKVREPEVTQFRHPHAGIEQGHY